MSPGRKANLQVSCLVYGILSIVPLAPLAAWWFDNGDLFWLLAIPVIFLMAG